MNNNNENQQTKPKPLKRLNLILERDENNDTAYIYMPGFSQKIPPRVSKSQHIETYNGAIIFDYQEDKICGIEIMEFSSKVNCLNDTNSNNHQNNGKYGENFKESNIDNLTDLNTEINRIKNLGN